MNKTVKLGDKVKIVKYDPIANFTEEEKKFFAIGTEHTVTRLSSGCVGTVNLSNRPTWWWYGRELKVVKAKQCSSKQN